MRIIITTTVIWLVLSLVCSYPMNGQQKLAQTGMKFLSVATDPRAVGMAEAFTAVEGNSSAMFFNPAGMARLNGLTSLMLGQTKWIADIKHNYGSIGFSPWAGEYGVIGLSIQFVDYGLINETIRDGDPLGNGYIDLGTFRPSALMVAAGYARALSDKFSVGGNVKYVGQSLGDATNSIGANGQLMKESNKTNVIGFDFGILYRTGFKSLNFGMTVRNLSKEVRYQKEGFQLPLTFKVGVSMDVFDLVEMDHEMHALLIAVDAEHPRDFAEQMKFGAEYVFMKILALRIGYVNPADEHGISYGVGVQESFQGIGLGVDYAYVPFGVFGDVHRFSLQFSL